MPSLFDTLSTRPRKVGAVFLGGGTAMHRLEFVTLFFSLSCAGFEPLWMWYIFLFPAKTETSLHCCCPVNFFRIASHCVCACVRAYVRAWSDALDLFFTQSLSTSSATIAGERLFVSSP